MRRRQIFMTGLVGGLLAMPGLQAQQTGKVHRIGILLPTPEPQPVDLVRLMALRGALRELGWVDGKNVIIESRHAGLDLKRQRELAAELKALPVALILAAGTTTIRAARDGAPGVPIVMVYAGDPLGAGLVASLVRPGGDLTGTSAAGEEILSKQLELLLEVAPLLKRVGVLMNAANPANGFFFDAMSARGSKLGLQLDRINVTAAGDLDGAVARAEGGGLVVLGDPMFGLNRARITELALQIPRAGGLWRPRLCRRRWADVVPFI